MIDHAVVPLEAVIGVEVAPEVVLLVHVVLPLEAVIHVSEDGIHVADQAVTRVLRK